SHQTPDLAIPFWPCHAEIVLEPALCVGPFFGTDRQNTAATEPADAADDGHILGKGPVSGERHEIRQQTRDVVERVRTLGVARHLDVLPRGQTRIGLTQQTARSGLEAANLVRYVQLAARRQMTEFGNLAF